MAKRKIHTLTHGELLTLRDRLKAHRERHTQRVINAAYEFAQTYDDPWPMRDYAQETAITCNAIDHLETLIGLAKMTGEPQSVLSLSLDDTGLDRTLAPSR